MIAVRAGVLDADVLERVTEGIAARTIDGPVIVDLSDLTLAYPTAVREMLGRLAQVGAGVVCDRPTGRRLLDRLGDGGVRIFPSLESACSNLAAAC